MLRCTRLADPVYTLDPKLVQRNPTLSILRRLMRADPATHEAARNEEVSRAGSGCLRERMFWKVGGGES